MWVTLPSHYHMQNHWEELTLFLRQAGTQPHNNLCERSMNLLSPVWIASIAAFTVGFVRASVFMDGFLHTAISPL